MFLESVNVSRVRPMAEARMGSSGIFREPVPSARITAGGVIGDTIVDLDVHGGPDQAVYVYARDDYDHWSAELGRPLAAGLFGENLTVSTMGEGPVRVGDRLRIGPVELEVTAPRTPCRTFQAVMGEPDWVRRFGKAGRLGYYCRVLSEGEVAPGDAVERTFAPDSHVTTAEVDVLYHSRQPDPELLRRALASPIAARSREYLERRAES